MQRRPDSPGTAGALSLSNVEKTREFVEAYNRRDFDTAVRWFDPKVEWVLPDQQGFDSCVGPDQIILWWEELDEIYALSDRILTLYEGRITGEYPPDAPPEEVGVGMLGGRMEEAS